MKIGYIGIIDKLQDLLDSQKSELERIGCKNIFE